MRETAWAMMFSCVAILKCTGGGKTTDIEMTVMKEEVYTHRYLKTGCTACHAGSCRRHSGKRAEHAPQSLLGFWGKKWERQGRYAE